MSKKVSTLNKVKANQYFFSSEQSIFKTYYDRGWKLTVFDKLINVTVNINDRAHAFKNLYFTHNCLL